MVKRFTLISLLSLAYVACIDFQYIGEAQTYTIPITGSYTITAYGAAGGDDVQDASLSSGGLGGSISSNYFFVQGDILYVNVGQSPTTQTGGYNGGGNAGFFEHVCGGAGGGSSDVRLGSNALSMRLIVAGGGGGAGHEGNDGDITGGNGGDAIGAQGSAVAAESGSYGGYGGNQTAGGEGGYPGPNSGVSSSGSSGVLLTGGTPPHNTCGGGGGGGYYGGGGGSLTAGGGGSSYSNSTILSNLQGAQAGNGMVTIVLLSAEPSQTPTLAPTPLPTSPPTVAPTLRPSAEPTFSPTAGPTSEATTYQLGTADIGGLVTALVVFAAMSFAAWWQGKSYNILEVTWAAADFITDCLFIAQVYFLAVQYKQQLIDSGLEVPSNGQATCSGSHCNHLTDLYMANNAAFLSAMVFLLLSGLVNFILLLATKPRIYEVPKWCICSSICDVQHSCAARMVVMAASCLMNIFLVLLCITNAELNYYYYGLSDYYYRMTYAGILTESIPQLIIQASYAIVMSSHFNTVPSNIQIASFYFTIWRIVYGVVMKTFIKPTYNPALNDHESLRSEDVDIDMDVEVVALNDSPSKSAMHKD